MPPVVGVPPPLLLGPPPPLPLWVGVVRELLSHLRHRLRSLHEEEWVPTHGDLKYDQLVHHQGRFGIIDWDFFAMTETSFDLAKYCAHLVPSQPDTWEDFLRPRARTTS